MRVEIGAPVVVVDGAFGRDLWHVPAPRRKRRCGALTLEAAFERMLVSNWPTRCGLSGELYAYDGLIREAGRHGCGVCIHRTPIDLVVPANGPLPRPQRGGRPKGSGMRVSEEQLAALHQLLYLEQGLSPRQVGERVWQQLGYASPRSCGMALWSAWRERGFEIRDRIDAVKLRCTTHGLAPKHGPRPGYGTYKRKVVHGQPDRPRCEGRSHRGHQCRRKAMHGSVFCEYHEPSRVERRAAQLADMRSRSPRHRPENLIAVGVIQPDLREWFVKNGQRWRLLVAASGLSNTALRRYMVMDPERRILRTTAARIRAGIDEASDPGLTELVERIPAKAHAVGDGRAAHPWADALASLVGERYEVRFRHEPEPHARALVERMGGVVVIDPNAEACCPDCRTAGETTTSMAA